MRYVIFFASLMLFFIWDGLYNHGMYLDQTVRGLNQLRAVLGL